jgi:hypothetical protein
MGNILGLVLLLLVATLALFALIESCGQIGILVALFVFALTLSATGSHFDQRRAT